VLKGVAGPALLETYEMERWPASKFTVEQAYTRYVTRSATYLGAKDFQPVANDFDIELGYLYQSPAVIAEEDLARGHEDPRQSFGRPGSRAPHLWIDRAGRKASTLDFYGRSFVLLAAAEGEPWVEAARAVAPAFAGLLDAHVVPDEQFAPAHGLTRTGATLVRPDGFVAWRAREASGDPGGAIATALKAVLING
jgi:putative polyketide hydroxylase